VGVKKTYKILALKRDIIYMEKNTLQVEYLNGLLEIEEYDNCMIMFAEKRISVIENSTKKRIYNAEFTFS
jgi:hypothetical protein